MARKITHNQLRYLEDCELDLTTRTKQPNGAVIETYEKVGDYKVEVQELNDQVSASIYGANVFRMSRICSPNNVLENYLYEKMVKTSDNVSKYTLLVDDRRYKITTVKQNWIDVELL